jgi:hypothetical protein
MGSGAGWHCIGLVAPSGDGEQVGAASGLAAHSGGCVLLAHRGWRQVGEGRRESVRVVDMWVHRGLGPGE